MLSFTLLTYALKPQVKATGLAIAFCTSNLIQSIVSLIIGAIEGPDIPEDGYLYDFYLWIALATIGVISAIALVFIDRYEGGRLNSRDPNAPL